MKMMATTQAFNLHFYTPFKWVPDLFSLRKIANSISALNSEFLLVVSSNPSKRTCKPRDADPLVTHTEMMIPTPTLETNVSFLHIQVEMYIIVIGRLKCHESQVIAERLSEEFQYGAYKRENRVLRVKFGRYVQYK